MLLKTKQKCSFVKCATADSPWTCWIRLYWRRLQDYGYAGSVWIAENARILQSPGDRVSNTGLEIRSFVIDAEGVTAL